MVSIRPLTLLTLGILSTCSQAVLVIDSFSGSSNGNSSASGPTAGFFLPGTFVDREAAFDFHTVVVPGTQNLPSRPKAMLRLKLDHVPGGGSSN